MLRARRLPNYLVREIVPLYAFGVATLLVLLLIDLFASLLGYLFRFQPPLVLVFQVVLDRLPFLLSYSLAPALAFAILVGLGRVAKDSELKAAFASGVRPISLLAPIIALGAVIAGLAFLNSNLLQPTADARFKDDIYRVWFGRPQAKFLETQSYADRSGENPDLFHAGSIAPKDGSDRVAQLNGVMVVTPEATYTAQSGVWDSETHTWELFNVFRTPTGGSDLGEATRVNRKVFELPAAYQSPPFQPPPEHLPLGALIRRVQDSTLSFENRYQAQFQLNRRFADPVAAVILALVGGAIGLRITNRAWGFAGVIGLVFGYYVLWTLGTNLAKDEAVPVLVAAWLPTAVFLAGGLAALRRLA